MSDVSPSELACLNLRHPRARTGRRPRPARLPQGSIPSRARRKAAKAPFILPLKRDQRDLAPIIRLAAMRCAAIAEEPIGIGVGVQPQRVDAVYPGIGNARDDVGFEVELMVPRDRKSTRLNSKSLMRISYAVFC